MSIESVGEVNKHTSMSRPDKLNQCQLPIEINCFNLMTALLSKKTPAAVVKTIQWEFIF